MKEQDDYNSIFLAVISKISTQKDGGTSVTFSIPENENEQVKKLFDFQNMVVSVAVVPRNE